MANGLKMFFARHKERNNKILSISLIGPEDRESLFCQFCEAKITWVQPHKRGEKNVSAYLRLGRNAAHTEGCKNLVNSAIEALVSQSKKIEASKDIFTKEKNAFIFRMNVLVDTEAEENKEKRAFEEESDPEEKERKGRRYQRTSNQLTDYFNSAAGIVKIRARIEESDDKKILSDLIKIELNKKLIDWEDFFYAENRYHILFEKAPNIKHPIAIMLTVKKAIELVPSIKNEFFTVKGDACIIDENINGFSKTHFSPAINANTKEFLQDLNPDDEIIVIGKVKVKQTSWKHIIYKNITLWISNKKQISKLSEL